MRSVGIVMGILSNRTSGINVICAVSHCRGGKAETCGRIIHEFALLFQLMVLHWVQQLLLLRLVSS